MRTHSPENSYIQNLDHDHIFSQQEKREKLSYDAEDVVIDFIESQFEEFEARKSTTQEDIGRKSGLDTGKQIDAVVYKDKQAVLGVQVTTAESLAVQRKKMMHLKDRPFVRLDEMHKDATPMPKALVFITQDEVQSYLKDMDWNKNLKLQTRILEGLETSLKFDRLQTQNQAEQARVDELLNIIANHKKETLNRLRPH